MLRSRTNYATNLANRHESCGPSPFAVRSATASRSGSPSIARFTANSLSTPTFRWLHSEAWNERHFEFFLAKRPKLIEQLLATVPYITYRSHRPPPPEMAGRWILEMPVGGELVAWVELQSHAKSFSTVHVLVSGCQNTDATPEASWNEPASEALAFLLSAVAIMTSADIMRVFSGDEKTNISFQQLVDQGWGVLKKLWSPTKDWPFLTNPKMAPGRIFNCIEIDPHSWWLTTWGKQNKKTLAYLDMRTSSVQKSLTSRRFKRKRRNLFERLLRWY